ncbi:hypothetical protein F5Y16DRAFT_139215 [Xylariaceae sp. FL0255]|nr:hypothetical protein F5Y16DRAFT_139215 [Xylariaceae sp. FL0255]
MIRHQLQTAASRTVGARSDFARVTEGIAASLRSFSSAQRFAADEDSNPTPQTGRQRATAAFNDLVSTHSSSPPSNEITSGNGNGNRNGGNRNGTGFRSIDLRSAAPESAPMVPKGNIIRGGFRGRGGGSFGFRGRGGAGAGGPSGGRGGRGGFGGASRRRFDDDDGSPTSEGRSSRGRGRGGRGGRGRRRRRNREDGEDGEDGKQSAEVEANPGEVPEPKHVQEVFEREAIGVTSVYNPDLTYTTLSGYGPSAPVVGSSFSHSETALRQARYLGGAVPYDPMYVVRPSDYKARLANNEAVFFGSPEVKKWVEDAIEVEFPPAAKETKDAVLDAAMLGRYEGPSFAETNDTLGTVRNYVRKDGTWNADASRRIEEKIRSMLPKATASAAGKASGAAASKA